MKGHRLLLRVAMAFETKAGTLGIQSMQYNAQTYPGYPEGSSRSLKEPDKYTIPNMNFVNSCIIGVWSTSVST